ncbi:MAG: agmatine deiminase family protein [Tannerellaceae bacterium]|jgi:agmatine/peptidylarginine deiminase|nr:agmatine deiminase family protein [Tannerellaceae bacterium]
MDNSIFFPPEWFRHSAVQLTWPHRETDWRDMLEEATDCFTAIAREIVKRERLIIVAPDVELVKRQLGNRLDVSRIIWREMITDDTWARDHGGITVFRNGEPVIYDFGFNGWGGKYPSTNDNCITSKLFLSNTFAPKVATTDERTFILEGGSIETNGKDTILTTSSCLLSSARNAHCSKEEIEERLRALFGVRHVLWLEHGGLAGDDTDGHIDTLARFCGNNCIAYVKCDDENDEHYDALSRMEDELRAFVQENGEPFQLYPLPMAEKFVFEGKRLPATYANFLIMNEAVLMPAYLSPKDKVAQLALQALFPDREVVSIDCRALIKQHGSLHCVTMQYPWGVVED